MTTATKASVGIDVSKDSLDACIGLSFSNQQHKFPTRATFPNTTTGFRKLLVWAAKQLPSKEIPLWFVMEATGVYYENLAYFLTDKKRKVAVVLPTKMKHFAKTLETRSKTDQLDARAISQFGLERPLSAWNPPSAQLRYLKELSREHEALLLHATQVKNQLHAKHQSHEAGESTIARLVAQRDLYKRQLRTIVQEMHSIVEHDANLNARITNITTAKGLGFMTAVKVVAETGGFALFRNQKQLVSYAGYDIVLKESGKRSGKPAISKKGNSHLRAAVYMPALVAIRHNKRLKEVFLRLVRTKGNKMVAVIAIARKLLCLIFTLWRSKVPYDPNYLSAHTA